MRFTNTNRKNLFKIYMKQRLFTIGLLVFICGMSFGQDIAGTIDSGIVNVKTQMNQQTQSSVAQLSARPPRHASTTDNEIISLKSTDEFSVFVGEGLSGISYTIKNGTVTMSSGMNFGIGYSYFMTDYMAVSTGLGLSFFYTTATLPTVMHKWKGGTDPFGGDVYYYDRTLSGYTERQSVTTLNVPIILHFQSKSIIYGRAGVQLGIPISTSFIGSNATILQGYMYEFVDGGYSSLIYETVSYPNERIEGGIFHQQQRTVGDLELKFSIALSLEVGMRLNITKRHLMYVGAYFDYGLNSLVRSQNEKQLSPTEFVISNTGSLKNFSTNSLLDAADPSTIGDDPRTAKPVGSSFVDGAHLMAVGIRARYGFAMISGRAASVNESIRRGGSAAVPQSRLEAILSQMQGTLSALVGAQDKSVAEKKSAQATAQTPPKKLEKKDRERLLRTIREPLVGFAPRQTSLNSTQKVKLSQKATAWKKMPDVKIVCYGYTSDLGDEALSIGLKRAQAVKNYLVQKGVNKNRISVVSRGAENPLAPNINMVNRNMNNRVEIVEK
ncbi:hypothetical protein FACS189467_1090 [Bacteroidia bacterium]|nr:hypothetical protein FACS189467_1090 [Bacteroidia bacterium]